MFMRSRQTMSSEAMLWWLGACRRYCSGGGWKRLEAVLSSGGRVRAEKLNEEVGKFDKVPQLILEDQRCVSYLVKVLPG